MNYNKHYTQLINKAKTRKLLGYKEKHHVIPKCMGGTDSSTNLVILTPEEHYLAHLLLVKMYPDNNSLVYAANNMTVSTNKHKRSNNKRYGWLKRKYQEICKNRIGINNPSYGKRWYYNPKTFENRKLSPSDVPLGWIKGRVYNNYRPAMLCKKCGQCKCERKSICKNTQRIVRLVSNFGFDSTVIGTTSFYTEYDRVVYLLRQEYEIDLLSVEELRVKYNIANNETMRCILKSLGIERRTLSDAVKNYCNKRE